MKVSLQITKKIQNTNNTETENKCGGNNLDRLAFKVRINRIIQAESLAETNALRHWKSVVYSRNRVHIDPWSSRLGYMIICLTSLFVCKLTMFTIELCSCAQKCVPLTVYSISASVTTIHPVSQTKNLKSFLSLFSISLPTYKPSGNAGSTSKRKIIYFLSISNPTTQTKQTLFNP